jgi:surfactin synthase thioesterase subunit
MKVDPGQLRSQEPAITPYLSSQPSEEPRLRLFCFHHAGGGASIFGGWPPVLSRLADVLPVQLPGREKRIREPRITDRAILIDELEHHLGPFLRRPYVFYGHSMGGLIAYGLAQQLLAHGHPAPEQLVVGASSAPHLPPLPPGVEDLPDDQLAAWLIQMGGMSAMLLDYPDWLRAATSLVRDDLSLCRSSPRRDLPPLLCPIQAFAGADDPMVPAAAVAAWAEHTQAPSDLRQVPGGHLFIRDSASAFLTQMASILETVISAHDEAGVRPT